MPNEAGVSIVIPAYNEERRIESALGSYLPVLDAMSRPYEVIVVIDGNDRTASVVESHHLQRVICLEFGRRLGKGGAIIEGFRHARFDTIGYVDADGSLDPRDLPSLIEGLARADCVIGSRWLPDSHWLKRGPFLNRLASRAYNVLVRSVLGLQVTDTQCGAKFYSSHLLTQLLRCVRVTNMTVDTAMIFHAHRLGARIVEIPVRWTHDEATRFSLVKMVWIMLLTVVGIRVMNARTKRYVPSDIVHGFLRLVGNE